MDKNVTAVGDRVLLNSFAQTAAGTITALVDDTSVMVRWDVSARPRRVLLKNLRREDGTLPTRCEYTHVG